MAILDIIVKAVALVVVAILSLLAGIGFAGFVIKHPLWLIVILLLIIIARQ